MRVTGGQAKGRRIETVKGFKIRPTSDRVREAVFNLLGQDLSGLGVLDLFSGTGSLAIESLSRGASHAVLVDKSQQSVDLIRKNLRQSGFEGQGIVLKKDLTSGLPQSPSISGGQFGIVFLDPPYRDNPIPVLLEQITVKRCLIPGARAVAETTRNRELPHAAGDFRIIKTKTYGDTRISIYIYEETDDKKNSCLPRIF